MASTSKIPPERLRPLAEVPDALANLVAFHIDDQAGAGCSTRRRRRDMLVAIDVLNNQLQPRGTAEPVDVQPENQS
jgi:hypothetical protein